MTLRRDVEVSLAEAVVLDGTIPNSSMSGAIIALRADPGRFAGALIRVGARSAKVIRPIQGEAAVQFVEPLLPDNFGERIRL